MKRTDINKALPGLIAGPITVRVSGDCMAPDLNDGQAVEVAPARLYWPGDVVVYATGDGRLLGHRFLGYYRRRGRWKMLIRADNARGPDPGVLGDQVLGRVVSIRPSVPRRVRCVGLYLQMVLRGLRRSLRGRA